MRPFQKWPRRLVLVHANYYSYAKYRHSNKLIYTQKLVNLKQNNHLNA